MKNTITNIDIINGFYMFGGADMYNVKTKGEGPRLNSDERIDKWIYTRLECNVNFLNEPLEI